MIYDENAAKAMHWESLAKQAFDRIIEQNKIIEQQNKTIDYQNKMIKFLEGHTGRNTK